MFTQEDYAFEMIVSVLVDDLDFDEDEIGAEDALKDLFCDDLDYAQLCIGLESTYGVELPEECEFNTVRDIVAYICQNYVIEMDEEE